MNILKFLMDLKCIQNISFENYFNTYFKYFLNSFDSIQNISILYNVLEKLCIINYLCMLKEERLVRFLYYTKKHYLIVSRQKFINLSMFEVFQYTVA